MKENYLNFIKEELPVGCRDSMDFRNYNINSFTLRNEYTKEGMFAFVSWDWVKPLASWITQNNFRCLEVMSGRGWLSLALKSLDVNIITTDNFSWHERSQFKKWNDIVTQIENLDAVESIKKYGKDIDLIIMSWPDMDEVAYNVLCEMNRQNPDALLLYIGEGEGGCTADDKFFEYFREVELEEFNDISNKFNSWWGIHDRLWLGKYL